LRRICTIAPSIPHRPNSKSRSVVEPFLRVFAERLARSAA
jgi:hypothetical protein